MTFTHGISTNNYGPAKFIVDASAANGSHTTIASALTSASSGDTIFIRPGTYTENIILKAGVNLSAYICDSSLNATGHVIINGTCSMTTAGTVTISGIELQTNSAALLSVTGSAASVVELVNCYLNMSNNTGITFSSSNATSSISISECRGNLGTTGIGIFSHSSSGTLSITRSIFSNSGASTTANTCSAGGVSLTVAFLANPITCSGTGKITAKFSEIDTAGNTTALTTVSGQVNELDFVRLSSGSATPLSVGGTVTASSLLLHHTNGTAVTGAGVFVYSDVMQDSTVGTISAGTNTGKVVASGGVTFDGGTNNLTNYAVGDWTPTFTGSSANPTSVTYTTQVGKYIRIGAMVFVSCTLTVNAVTLGPAAGNLQVSGLPFTAKNTTNYTPILATQVSSFDLQAATKWINGQVQPNSLNVAFVESVDNSGATVTAVTILAANTQVRFSGCYET